MNITGMDCVSYFETRHPGKMLLGLRPPATDEGIGAVRWLHRHPDATVRVDVALFDRQTLGKRRGAELKRRVRRALPTQCPAWEWL